MIESQIVQVIIQLLSQIGLTMSVQKWNTAASVPHSGEPDAMSVILSTQCTSTNGYLWKTVKIQTRTKRPNYCQNALQTRNRSTLHDESHWCSGPPNILCVKAMNTGSC